MDEKIAGEQRSLMRKFGFNR